MGNAVDDPLKREEVELTRTLNASETELLLAALTGAVSSRMRGDSATLAEIYRAASQGR